MKEWLAFIRKYAIVIITAIILLTLLSITVPSEDQSFSLVQWGNNLVVTVIKPFGRAADWVESQVVYLASLKGLADRNAEQENLISELEQEVSALERHRTENRILRKLLNLNEEIEFATTTAKVIGHSPDYWYKYIVLDKGSNDGVAKDMAVMSSKGLVGKVISVNFDSCTVLLLTDSDFGVSAYAQRTADFGVALGMSNTCCLVEMRLFTLDNEVEIGDLILTSGQGGIIPPELPIGEVTEVMVREQGLAAYATIAPFVDFDRLQYVVIVMSDPSTIVSPVL